MGRAVLLAGGSYFLVPGILFAELAGRAASPQGRFAWRLGAWLLSVCIFAAHLGHERLRLRHPALFTARNVALAVALGACALAAAALVRALATGTGKPQLLALALVLWPVLSGVPAFAVAWAATTVIGGGRRERA
jgi:hypothetical protein